MRRWLKLAVFTGCCAVCAPLTFIAWLEKRVSRSELLFTLFAQSLAILPGFPGQWLRGAYYFGTLDRCSWETHIGFGSLFTHRGAVVGARVSMGAYCVIGHASIGDEVMIGSRVSIPSGKRQHLDERGGLMADVSRFDQVSIGGRSWIGEGAIIMADIGERSIVSAGAVVSRGMPPASLVGGSPAKVIRDLAASGEGSGRAS